MYAIRSYYVRDPAHARFFGSRNDRMPSFGKDQILKERGVDMIDVSEAEFNKMGTNILALARITSYNVCYTKLLRPGPGRPTGNTASASLSRYPSRGRG